MSEHKFKVGQTIGFRSYLGARAAAPGQYQILALIPDQDGEPTYRIKSTLEKHERIAREGELRWTS